MKELSIKDYKVYLDDSAYDILNYYTWRIIERKDYDTKYCARCVKVEGKKVNVYLHRLVAGVPQFFHVDWLNCNHLDCTSENILITDKNKIQYQYTPFSGKSNFQGVKWCGYYGLWEANFHGMTVGYYANEIDAARAYNVKSMEIYRDRCNINSIEIMKEFAKNNGY